MSSIDRIRLARALAAGSLLVPLAHAGNVLRVGPGQTFTTVQAAVDAAAPGDLVLVDPGTYPGFAVDGKELAILAAGPAFSLAATAGVPEIAVRNVPAGSTVTIQGVHVDYDDRVAPAVLVEHNAGAVRLSQLEVVEIADLRDAAVTAAVLVEDTATFWLLDSSVTPDFTHLGNTLNPLCVGARCNDGISALELRDTSGAIQNSLLRGYFNDYTVLGSGGDGLRAIGECNLRLYQNAVPQPGVATFGGGHGVWGGNAVHQVRTPVAPNLIRSCSSDGRTPGYAPGSGVAAFGGEPGGYYGFNNDNGSYRVGSLILWRVVDHCDIPEWNEVLLDPPVVALGATLHVRIRSARDRAYALLLSDSTRHRSYPAFDGRALVDPARLLAVRFGTTPKEVVTSLSFPVASSSSLIGLQLTAQSLSGPVGGALRAFSLPSAAVIGP